MWIPAPKASPIITYDANCWIAGGHGRPLNMTSSSGGKCTWKRQTVNGNHHPQLEWIIYGGFLK